LVWCQELVDKTDMFSLYFNHIKITGILMFLALQPIYFRYLIQGDIHGKN